MKSQFNRLFATLSTTERRYFERFVTSSYFNQRPELVLTLYALENEAYEGLKPETKQRALKHWQSLTDTQQRLQRSDLLNLLEQFLGQYQAGTTATIRQHLRLKSRLQSRKQSIRYQANERKSDKLLAQLGDGQIKSRLTYEVKAERMVAKLKDRSLGSSDVRDLQQLQERNFLLESLRLACDGLSAKAVSAQDLNNGLLPLAVDYLEKQIKYSDDVLLNIYLNCYQTLKDVTDDEPFYRLQSAIHQLSKVDAVEARDVILLAINTCIRRINSNRPDGERYAFQLYTLGLEAGYLLDDGVLSRFTFNNIVALALKTGDKERATAFVDRYASLLPNAYAQSTESLNRARLAFEYGRLEEAMDYLQSAKDQDVLTTLNIRMLQMRVYYELQANRLLDAHLDATDIYLRRRKEELGYRYKIYRNLIAFVREFRRLNTFEKDKVTAFREKVKAADQLPERSWLLKISE